MLGTAVTVKGWVRTKRDQKTFSFVEINDGSCMKGVQVRETEENGGWGEGGERDD